MQRVGVGACPLLALIGARLWLASNGPATASASTPTEAIVQPKFAGLPEPTEDQQRLIARARALEGVQPPSPFPRSEMALIAVPDMPLTPGAPEPKVEPPPTLALTSVMGGRVPVAMVNGRPRSLGDLVAPGWKIVEINPDRIVIEHSDGRQISVNLQRGTP